MNDSIKRLADFLEMPYEKAEEFSQKLPLLDFTALMNAIDNQDYSSVNKIYNKYKHVFASMPTEEEVSKFYMSVADDSDEEEAVTKTADHFGIRGEDVQDLLHLSNKFESALDTPVTVAVEQITNALEGKETEVSLNELNTWQRYQMLQRVPVEVVNLVNKMWTMGPEEVMKEHAKMHGFETVGIAEMEANIEDMRSALLAHHLKSMVKIQNEEIEPVSDVMGTISKDDCDDEDKEHGSEYLIKSIVSKKF